MPRQEEEFVAYVFPTWNSHKERTEWMWHIRTRNNKDVSGSLESYVSKSTMKKMFKRLHPDMKLVDEYKNWTR